MNNEYRKVMIDNEPKVLLSICTPTYNRADLFQKSLEILLPQVSKYRDKVSMHISDNASTDGTETMIQTLSAKYNVAIDYYRQSENVGLERNYAKVTSMSDGRYTFVLCDDDLLAPNFLQTILDYIDTDEEYGLIHFNWMHADENYNAFYIQNKPYSNDVYMPVDKFWKLVNASPDFSSAVIFNTKVWNIGVCENDEFDGDGFWGFARIVKGSCVFDKICIYHHFPLVIERAAGRSYAPFSPYYNYVVISKIFLINEKLRPVFEFWQNALSGCSLLENIYLDVPFYREHRDEMKAFMTKEHLDLYDYILNAKNPRTAYKKWMYKQLMKRRIIRLWKRIINH